MPTKTRKAPKPEGMTFIAATGLREGDGYELDLEGLGNCLLKVLDGKTMLGGSVLEILGAGYGSEGATRVTHSGIIRRGESLIVKYPHRDRPTSLGRVTRICRSHRPVA